MPITAFLSTRTVSRSLTTEICHKCPTVLWQCSPCPSFQAASSSPAEWCVHESQIPVLALVLPDHSQSHLYSSGSSRGSPQDGITPVRIWLGGSACVAGNRGSEKRRKSHESVMQMGWGLGGSVFSSLAVPSEGDWAKRWGVLVCLLSLPVCLLLRSNLVLLTNLAELHFLWWRSYPSLPFQRAAAERGGGVPLPNSQGKALACFQPHLESSSRLYEPGCLSLN